MGAYPKALRQSRVVVDGLVTVKLKPTTGGQAGFLKENFFDRASRFGTTDFGDSALSKFLVPSCNLLQPVFFLWA